MKANYLRRLIWIVGLLIAVSLLVASQLMNNREGRPATADQVSEKPTDYRSPSVGRAEKPTAAAPFVNSRTIEYEEVIPFPDGTVLRLNWHSMPTPRVSVTPPYADDYDVLRTAAEGENAESAFRLWQILTQCKFAFEERDDLQSALNMLQEKHMVQLPGTNEARHVPRSESRQALEQNLQMAFDNCRGLTAEQKAEAIVWLETAARVRYPVAMMEYSSVLHDYESGVELDLARWAAGDAHALQSLAGRYRQSYESGDAPENKVAAYAALYAYTRIAEVRFRRGGGTPDPRLESSREALERFADRMHQYEVIQAIDMAKKTIAENPNCCFSF